MRNSSLVTIASGVCASALLLAAKPAHAEDHELWFVSDVMAVGSGYGLDCADTQPNAENTLAIVESRMQNGAILMTTEINNCRDYDEAYTLFTDWLRPNQQPRMDWFGVPGNHDYYDGTYDPATQTWTTDGYPDAFLNASQLTRNDPTSVAFRFSTYPWIVVGLDSELTGSRMEDQKDFLHDELLGAIQPCQVAFSHRPAISNASKYDGRDNGRLDSELVDILADFNVELLLSGHEHAYERLAPNQPTLGGSNMVQIVAGTGGASMGSSYAFNDTFVRGASSNGHDRQNDANGYGVVRLELRDNGSYTVEFYRVSTDPVNYPEGELYDTYTSYCQW